MIADLFDHAAASIMTPERSFVHGLADSCFRERPKEPVWQWAGKNVWLGDKMSPQPKLYDPEQTPWAKEWHQLPMMEDVREAWVMKCSRSSFTESGLNIIRYMPENWPGNVLFAINSREEAKKVSKTRLKDTLKASAGAKLTDNPDDVSTHHISLLNMDIVVSGSGAAGPFMQTWYRFIVLDELENHEDHTQETTTVDRARSRLVGVADGKIYGGSKPELAGGVIDLQYIRGSQKKWLVPCPRCERRIELLMPYIRFAHCKERDGWNLARVMAEAYYQCQLCNNSIFEHEKWAMINAGEWVPTPSSERRRPPSGNAVAAEPGVESYHISDLYSLWTDLTWGFLAKEYLSAYVIEPNLERQKYFRTNHEGLPFEPVTTQIKEDTVLSLVGGIVEERGGRAVTLGQPFELAYHDEEYHAPLPFTRPIWITVTGDKQEHCIKYWVQAWFSDGQGFLIDCGFSKDYDAFIELFRRPYYTIGQMQPHYIGAGLIDCGEDKMDVLRCCLKAQAQGFQLHPSRGSGFHSEFRDKTIRYRPDVCDGQQIVIREFYDHAIKSDFMLGKIGKRTDPRLWFPRDLVTVAPWVIQELRAERLQVVTVNGRRVQKWTHDKQKHGPNDALDLGKNQYVIFQEIKEDLKKLGGGNAGPIPVPDAPNDASKWPRVALKVKDSAIEALNQLEVALIGLEKEASLYRDEVGKPVIEENGTVWLHAPRPLVVGFLARRAGLVDDVIIPEKTRL